MSDTCSHTNKIEDFKCIVVSSEALSDKIGWLTVRCRELEERIRQAIDRLPSQCRQVFKMSRFEGKHNPEIAEQLGISVNTVKYHLRYALSFLRKDLQKYLLLIILFFFNH